MENLPTTMKSERRWRSKPLQTTKPSLVMAFFSCLAWLYVAGRLWQDAENRKLLTNLLYKNSLQRPKVLTVEDKLTVLGCRKLEERGVVIRFVVGRSANRGDSLDRNIDKENRTTKDFLILEGHEEAQEELPKKVKYFFSTAVQKWDAEFYVKVDDNIDLDLEGLIGLLDRRRGQDGAYIGCMKSGDVISEEGKPWYEPDWWKFGDEKSYFRHAAGSLLILSKNLAQYININSASLKTYAHDDVSMGSWMMGIQATYIDDNRLCCSSIRQDKVCSLA
ncbi:hypothetical protein I3843_07G220400 [Carya illinoinensis]|uniref:Hexosyltransferase n=1 Tax=Carya illinoinensis TaxID=32201 RepID=A0A922ENE0_CARIL|nr:hypothetical protein I3842_07G226900 [Carya illinoinensis]KAG7973292.1 hypothetical protein I3843_07G220400 [Carya illinoinensis]